MIASEFHSYHKAILLAFWFKRPSVWITPEDIYHTAGLDLDVCRLLCRHLVSLRLLMSRYIKKPANSIQGWGNQIKHTQYSLSARGKERVEEMMVIIEGKYQPPGVL